MTAKDSADVMLGDIAAARATAAWNIANFVLEKCGLTHTRKDLQGFGHFGDGLDPCMLQNPVQFPTDVQQTPESRARKAAACLLKTLIKSKKATVKPILGRINAPRLPNGRYRKLQAPALPDKSSRASPSLTTCSRAVAATWTRSPDATPTSPMISSSSTTSSF